MSISLITLDLEMDWERFSKTISTSMAEVQPAVSARTDGERVKLMKVKMPSL